MKKGLKLSVPNLSQASESSGERCPATLAERSGRNENDLAKSNQHGNRGLWLLGVAFAGLYGAGFTLAQLLNVYVPLVYHVPETTSGLLAAVLTLSAIPGSILGGYFFDRAKRPKLVIIIPWLVAGLALIIFPFVNLAGLWVMVILLGGVPYAGFSGWAAVPGRYRDRVLPEDVATADGVLLTLAAVGGFVVPIVIGQIAGAHGFTSAWIFGGVVSIIFALVAFAAREPVEAVTLADQPADSMGQPAKLTT
jgi:MFS transporter, ACS family, D-galactonate transporter